MPLTWDFARQLDPSATPGSTVSYFDMMTQSLYVDSGQIKTQIASLDHGHWVNLEREPEVAISDVGYGVLDIEHNFNGSVFGTSQHQADVVLLLYDYMMDVSSWITEGEWNCQADNPIKVGSIKIQNVEMSRFDDDAHTVFAPGSRVRLRYRMGDSTPQPFGTFFIEDSPYSYGAESFAFRGRNLLGFFLANQTLDERTTYAGTRTYIISQLLADAGVSSQAMLVEESATVETFVSESSKNYFQALQEATTLFDWYFDDLQDGTIVVGTAQFLKDNVAKTGIYAFNLGPDCISQSRSRHIDGAYSRLCVRRKGDTPLSLYAPIPYFEGWALAGHRTYYQDVPDTTDQATMERIRDQLVEGMQFSGITEKFKVKFSPQLQIGDVVIVTQHLETRIAGIVTDLKHPFGESGFFTEIVVTSGGVISNPDNPATVATKYVGRLGGANRQRRLTDYLISGSNTLSGTSMSGDKGYKGTPGSPGADGNDGASAYDVWLSLGNTGTEQDFVDSLGANVLPIGAIQLWPTGAAPTDWVLCDGQAVSRITYADLYELIGDTYGAGDGTTTFNLPTLTDPVTGISYMIRMT